MFSLLVSEPRQPLCPISPWTLAKGAAKLIKRFPNILGLSPEVNLEKKLTWLKENLQLSEAQVISMVTVSLPLWRGKS